MSAERWKPIPGFGGYDVSDRGRVRSYKKQAGLSEWVISDAPQRILKPGKHPAGYPSYNLRKNGKNYQRRVHTLVLLAFVGPRPDGLCICHYNGNPLDNRLSNLRYDTIAGNHADTARYNMLPDHLVIQIRELRAAGTPCATIAKEVSVPAGKVYDIVNGRTYESVGGPRTKYGLPDSTILYIRRQRRWGFTICNIAQRYDIDPSTVSLIVRGKRNLHIGGPIEGIDYPIVNPVFHKAGKKGAALRGCKA